MDKKYNWLYEAKAPKMIVEAVKLIGIHEVPGAANNPKIMAWSDYLGLKNQYSNDDVPWCGLFVGYIAKMAGKQLPTNPLWALNWARFGVKANAAMFGDVIVVKRPTGGHVGLYVGEDAKAYHVLGGNQGNEVTVARIAKDRVYAVRRPLYTIGQPDEVKKIFLSEDGVLSTNEQ